jgi:predicted ATP-grasp superfamily ATP-dependent carboligase
VAQEPAVTQPATHGFPGFPGFPAVSRTPDGYDVLILDAGTRQSLASARSLGRAGLRVALAECFAECDPALPVLAFQSRYSARNVVLPSFATDPHGFSAGIIEFVRAHPTRVIMPASDGAIAALMPWRGRLAALGSQLALAQNAVLEVANSKARTLEVARGLGIEGPKSARVDQPALLAAAFAEIGLPCVLKPTIGWPDGAPARLQATEVISETEAHQKARAFLAAGAPVLVQELLSGRREGVTLLIQDNDVRATFAHTEHRTSPALGGASVLRESIPVPDDIFDAAARLVKALGLQGLCAVEFRRNAAGQPLLMEINARLAGQIETALVSGADFPLMTWQWATGQRVEETVGYRTGIRARWLRGDMRWLRDNHRRAGRPDSLSRARALVTFAAEFARLPHYDCFDRHDLRPVLAEIRTTVAAIRKSKRTPPSRETESLRKGAARAS